MTIIKHDFQRPRNESGQVKSGEEQKIPGFQLRIEVGYSVPTIWRTVNLPGTLTLTGLHKVIQCCFGWRDEATHRFLVGKIFYSPNESSTTGGSRSSSGTQLYQVEKDMAFIFSYLYDGGCGWECEISLEQVFPDAREFPRPVVVGGDRCSIPAAIEDIHEYQNLLARLEEAPEQQRRILAEAGVAPAFDPAFCDLTAINDCLADIR